MTDDYRTQSLVEAVNAGLHLETMRSWSTRPARKLNLHKPQIGLLDLDPDE
jgi:hypothetical protein